MKNIILLLIKNTVAVALAITLSACSNSSSDSVTVNDDPPILDDPEIPEEPDDIQSVTFGPPQFITSECGTLAVSSVTGNNALNNPQQLNIGQPVRGQIVPNSSNDNFHVWQATVEPGNYHLIVDANLANERSTNLGITVTSLGATSSDDTRLISDRKNGFDMRTYKFLEIRETTALKLKLDAVYDTIHNYSMVLIPNGSPVPSPTIEDCLPIKVTSVGTTEVATLTETQSRTQQPWYSVELADQEYTIDATASRTSSSNMGYRIVVLEQFGQTDFEKTVSNDRINSTNLITSDTFKPQAAGTVWLRVENVYKNDLTVELSVNAK